MNTNTILPLLLRLLAQYNLCTTARISTEVGLWSQLNTHLHDFFHRHKIILAPALPNANASLYEQRAWELLTFRATNEAHNRTLSVVGLVERKWDFQELKKIALRCIHPIYEHIEILFVGEY